MTRSGWAERFCAAFAGAENGCHALMLNWSNWMPKMMASLMKGNRKIPPSTSGWFILMEGISPRRCCCYCCRCEPPFISTLYPTSLKNGHTFSWNHLSSFRGKRPRTDMACLKLLLNGWDGHKNTDILHRLSRNACGQVPLSSKISELSICGWWRSQSVIVDSRFTVVMVNSGF